MADESANVGYETTEDFTEAYANNIYFEASAWDLKLIFGQLDQSGGKIRTVQHTAITLPWTQAKILSYWLRGHIEAHEMVNGKIHMPPSIIPAEVEAPTKELKQSEPNVERIYAVFNRLRDELIASLK
jgi:uncharacterized protein DUF3467